jgi:hypothetical protein
MHIPPSEFDSCELIPYAPELAPTESFSILVLAIIAALILLRITPG